ncbi:MAG: peptide MFS transporter [Bacteroidia bacterium]
MSNEQKNLLGHPVGLYICFFTEMWERFSFYGMKALLIFYLTKYHFFSDNEGNHLVGSYAALVYAMPVIGGMLADKYLGFRKAVTFGAILLVLGHLGMAYEGHQAYMENDSIVRDERALQVFYFSLALIIMGVGFLKPNISTIVGALYEEGDPRRDSGFTIFYMGINLGSALATIICGWLGENYGWSYGFGAAGIGMIGGLITFLWGQKFLMGKAEPSNPAVLKEKVGGLISREWLIYLGGIGGVFIAWQMVQYHVVVGYTLTTISIAAAVFLAWFLIAKCNPIERARMGVLIVLIIFTVIFWALFEQAYTSMNLFADRIIDRSINLSFINAKEIPASSFLSLNAIFIIIFAPILAWFWVKLGKLNPNVPMKFAFGIILAGLGFGMLVLGIKFADDAGKVAMIWLVGAYLLHTFGELCLSPVGLSAVTKLSVQSIVGVMMGTWFLATAGSEYIAALLANIASVETIEGEVADSSVALANYNELFSLLLWMGLGFGVLLAAISPILKKYMHGIK